MSAPHRTVTASTLHVREISAEETIPMRLDILRHGASRDDVVFPGDDDELTLHVGAFHGDELVGITSVYRDPLPEEMAASAAEVASEHQWRLRGVATAQAARRKGVASKLAEACLQHVRSHGGRLLWCNARTGAIDFYLAHGFSIVSDEFEIPGAGPHVVMQRLVD